MQKITVTDQMAMFMTNMTNATDLSSRRDASLNNMDSCRGERREYQMRDMLNLLEIKTNTKKMLHAPSLQTFILKRFQRTSVMSKKRMYMLLRAWRRIVRAECTFVVDFDSVYFDDKHDVAYLNFNYTGLYPLKVLLSEFYRMHGHTRQTTAEVRGLPNARRVERADETGLLSEVH